MQFAPYRLYAVLFALTACQNDASSPKSDAGDGLDDAGRPGSDASDDLPEPPDPDRFEGCLTHLKAPENGFIEVQRFVVGEPELTIVRARRPSDKPTVGETFAYELVAVALKSADEEACITDSAQLSYSYAHHNWDETWSVRTSRAHYAVRETYVLDFENQGWKDSLEVRSLEDDSLLFPAVELEADGCYSLPYNLNPCMQRTRTDKAPEGWGD